MLNVGTMATMKSWKPFVAVVSVVPAVGVICEGQSCARSLST
jgi:hypothetical protein